MGCHTSIDDNDKESNIVRNTEKNSKKKHEQILNKSSEQKEQKHEQATKEQKTEQATKEQPNEELCVCIHNQTKPHYVYIRCYCGNAFNTHLKLSSSLCSGPFHREIDKTKCKTHGVDFAHYFSSQDPSTYQYYLTPKRTPVMRMKPVVKQSFGYDKNYNCIPTYYNDYEYVTEYVNTYEYSTDTVMIHNPVISSLQQPCTVYHDTKCVT